MQEGLQVPGMLLVMDFSMITPTSPDLHHDNLFTSPPVFGLTSIASDL